MLTGTGEVSAQDDKQDAAEQKKPYDPIFDSKTEIFVERHSHIIR